MDWDVVSNLVSLVLPTLIGFGGLALLSKLLKRKHNLTVILGIMITVTGLMAFVANVTLPLFMKFRFGIDLDDYYHPHYDQGIIVINIFGVFLTLTGALIVYYGLTSSKKHKK